MGVGTGEVVNEGEVEGRERNRKEHRQGKKTSPGENRSGKKNASTGKRETIVPKKRM